MDSHRCRSDPRHLEAQHVPASTAPIVSSPRRHWKHPHGWTAGHRIHNHGFSNHHLSFQPRL